MHFKRFLDFKTNNSNKKLIIFNNNKIIFDTDINNVLPDCAHLKPTRASFQKVLDVETRSGSDHLQ